MAILQCVLLVFTISTIFTLFRLTFKKRNNRFWPFVGFLPSLFLNFNRLHDKIAEILQENDGCFFLNASSWVLGRDVFVTSNPENARYVMSTRFSNFPKGDEWIKCLDIFGNGSFNTDFDEWKGHRKLIRYLFSHHKFQQLMGNTVQDVLTKELVPVLDLVSQQQLTLDFGVLANWYTSYFAVYISTGQNPQPIDIYNQEEDQLNKVLGYACKAIFLRLLSPEPMRKLMKRLGIGMEKKYVEAWETLDNMFAQYVSNCQKKIDKKYGGVQVDPQNVDVDDFNALTMYMVSHEIVVGSQATYNNMRDNVMSLIFAVADTTSTSLCWFFWLLSRNPAAEAKIRQELKKVAPIQQCEINNFFVRNSEELNKLVYLEAAINETLRLYPPVPYEMRSALHSDTLPSGHQVMEKANVLISIYGIGRMKSLWGEDCLEFKPERWITQDGKVRYEPPHKFSPFSSGPRICPGKDYAYVLMKTFIAFVMQTDEVEVEDCALTANTSILLTQKEKLMVKVKKIDGGC